MNKSRILVKSDKQQTYINDILNMGKRVRFIWEKADTARLIELLKNNEILWNQNDKHYNNRTLREEAYYEILEQLRDILPEDANTDDIRAKIGCIRTQHTRVLLAHKKTGKPINLWCFDELYFLRGEGSPPPEKQLCLEEDPLGDISVESDVSLDETKGGVWTQENLVILLEKYKQYRCLWDPIDKYYNTAQVRHKALKNISKSLSPRVHKKDIRRKIAYLRYMYKKMLRKRKSRVHGFQPIWWFSYMNFLRPIIENEASDDLVEEYQNSAEDSCDDGHETTADSINGLKSEIELSTPNTFQEKTFDKDQKRFKDLSKQVEETLYKLKDEKIITDLIDCTRQLLEDAISVDESGFHPADIIKDFQERQSHKKSNDHTYEDKETFDVKLTFDTQEDNMCILKSISELPYLQQIQLSGDNLRRAAKKQKK